MRSRENSLTEIGMDAVHPDAYGLVQCFQVDSAAIRPRPSSCRQNGTKVKQAERRYRPFLVQGSTGNLPGYARQLLCALGLVSYAKIGCL